MLVTEPVAADRLPGTTPGHGAMSDTAAPTGASPKKGGRFKELDALRGIAACTVVFCHFYDLRETNEHSLIIQILFRCLFRFLVAGHEAVLLFFVLSGFVLTLPFLKPKKPSYAPFIVKRICRIYLPYAGGVAIAVFADMLFHNKIPALSHWFQVIWSEPLSWGLVLGHLTMIGVFDPMQLNGAFWSLVIEMRISLIFPLLMWVLSPVRSHRAMLITAAAMVAIGLLPLPEDVIVYSMLHYATVFVIGSLLARSLEPCTRWYLERSSRVRAFFAVMALATWSFVGLIASQPILGGLYDMLLTAASCYIVVISLSEPRVQAFLLHRVSLYLGEISYSVYLLHVTILLSLVHALYGKVPLYAVFPVYLILVFALSAIYHRLVEVPSTHLGISLSKQIKA